MGNPSWSQSVSCLPEGLSCQFIRFVRVQVVEIAVVNVHGLQTDNATSYCMEELRPTVWLWQPCRPGWRPSANSMTAAANRASISATGPRPENSSFNMKSEHCVKPCARIALKDDALLKKDAAARKTVKNPSQSK